MTMTLTHRIAHITDTHIPDHGMLYGVLDSFGNLERALATAGTLEPGVDVLLLTGDLADLGQPAAYDRLRGAVEATADRLGIPAIFGNGNHDERGAFRVGLLDQPASEEPIDYVVDIGGLRFVMLDSTALDGHHGEVLPGQLDWLGEVLATPAPHGTVLAMHHPPLKWPAVHSPLNGDKTRAESAGIGDPSVLGEVVRGSDVRVVVSGHLHDTRTGTLAGIPVFAGASTANAMRAADRFEALPSSRMSIHDLYDDGSVVTFTVDLAPPAQALAWTYDQLREHYAHL
ncbi:MAG: metallophosphoesterase [Desertimonas sp.]